MNRLLTIIWIRSGAENEKGGKSDNHCCLRRWRLRLLEESTWSSSSFSSSSAMPLQRSSSSPLPASLFAITVDMAGFILQILNHINIKITIMSFTLISKRDLLATGLQKIRVTAGFFIFTCYIPFARFVNEWYVFLIIQLLNY